MTVVMKNDSDLAISRHSSGTTLFVRRQSYLGKDNDPLKSFDEAAEVFNPSRKRPDNDNNNNNRVVPVVGRGPEHQDDVRRDEFHAGRDNNDEDIEDDGANADSKSLTEITQCLDDVVQSTTSARLSREKRLMTHLGLKGRLKLVTCGFICFDIFLENHQNKQISNSEWQKFAGSLSILPH